MKHLLTLLTIFALSFNNAFAFNSTSYWQQHVDYTMDVNVDVETFTYQGTQSLVYTNNSPDVLQKVFYHLYFNAFQPESEMDVRSRTILDPSYKIGDRIQHLAPEDIGFLNVNSLSQNGVALNFEVVGTVLEVALNKPIQPGEKVLFEMTFDGQIPEQIRRSGKNNKEGVALSMAQWYPKMAEYDFEGWHADPYIAREFHGVWGDFDVKLTLDKNYMVGGTGYLQNPDEVGHGYETKPLKKHKGKTLTWHFKAPNVHDFTWAADPNFVHDKMQVPNGPMLHFLYKNDLEEKYAQRWKDLQPKTVALMAFFSEHIGKYPYEQYSVIQAGDGGMEYGMCTLITGHRTFKSLVSVTSHEMAHTWFQFLLATNEARHEWMDEGFTDYICTIAENEVLGIEDNHPLEGSYKRYIKEVLSGDEQPMSTHADRYKLNKSYSTSSYRKGAVFLAQLGYVIGEDNLKETLKLYFKTWAFKHPTPNDFIRCAEKVSGLELDWYLIDWTQTTNTIDYGVKSVKPSDENTIITLERIGLMPMPIDFVVELVDGTQQRFNIPLRIMRGEKPVTKDTVILEDWAWAHPTYEVIINIPKSNIKSVVIDPENKMADINKYNNKN